MKVKRFLIIVLLVLSLCASISEANFVVRTILFQPTDAPDTTEAIKDIMLETYIFYGNALVEQTGVFKPFRLEADGNGQAAVHVIRGRHNIAHYQNARSTSQSVLAEIPNHFKHANNSHVIFIGGLTHLQEPTNFAANVKVLGLANVFVNQHSGGMAFIPGGAFSLVNVGHELGHTFGLQHNHTPNTLMHGNGGRDGLENYEARWLTKSKYFSGNPQPVNSIPSVDKIHPISVTGEDMRTLKFDVDLSSPNGIWQAEIRSESMLDFHRLGGKAQETAHFDFDVRKLRGKKSAWFSVIDNAGNIHMRSIHLDIPPAAFMQPERVATTHNKPGENPTKKPTKPTAKPTKEAKPEPKEAEKAEENKPKEPVKPRQVKPRFKVLISWAKLKRL